MKNLLLALVLVSGCKVEKLVSVDVCGTSCYYEYLSPSLGVGPCVPGVWVCDPETNSQSCVGSVMPQLEECNRIDDDCDGYIDEDLPGCCVPGSPEVCDGIDNNCDGRIDEPTAPPATCYSADPLSMAFAPCRPGVLRCIKGGWVCDGERAPQVEVCNAQDDDCDGYIDEGLDSSEPVWIVFIIDNSGSMYSKIVGVQMAVKQFVSRYGNRPEIHWALVTAPDKDIQWGSQVRLFQNFTDAATFSVAIDLQNGQTGSGAEPSLDALLLTCQSQNPLGLSWGAGRRAIVLFTDEEPQTYMTPPTTAADIIAACTATGARIYEFVETKPVLKPEWKTIADATSGVVYEIQSGVISTQLQTLVAEFTCR